MPYQTPNKEGTADVLKKGAADYGSWMQLTASQVSTIKGIEGANTATPSDPYSERFAQIVYVLNQSSGGTTTSAITDGANDTLFATVTDLTNSNPLNTMLVDANGDQIVSFGATLLAETGTPTPVADGATVDLWVDAYGRQIFGGYNLSLQAMDVNLINDSNTERLGPVTNLNAVVANTTGAQIDVSDYHNLTFHLLSASTTLGATYNIETSMDGTNWATIVSDTIATDTVTEYTMSTVAYKYVRSTITGWQDGTFTSTVYAGN